MCENRTLASPPTFDFQTSTEISRTDGVSTHPINPVDGVAVAYRQLTQGNIEHDILAGRYGTERVDKVVELMLEVVLSRRSTIRIAGDDFPREVVKSRMLKLRNKHVEYVFDAIDQNTVEVRNIKAYLLTALYNVPATMDSYYRAAVNHDLYRGDTHARR